MRTAKSEEKIISAYMGLLEECGTPAEITVFHVSDRAQISRTTFYSYFESIDALTEHIAKQLCQNINDMISGNHMNYGGEFHFRDVYAHVLTYIRDHQLESKLVLLDDTKVQLLDFIGSGMVHYLTDYYKKSGLDADPAAVEQTAIFWTSGFVGILKEWVKNGCEEEPERMAELVCQAIDNCSRFISATK